MCSPERLAAGHVADSRSGFVYQHFGTALRGRRAAVGLSQEALAAEAKLHRNYIGLLERGQRMPSILVVQQFAAALGTTMSELLAEVEEEQD
jgi:transcriptional regulator with XRE-family HTH domain